ncbi:IclR family transcriptional regulator C-terminal domain-containing protein [Variovorax sp. MHTC-1]|uniref:IclR family transcriptional regulator domain-containing protein n=1 Tax=Variovorax sp. MHTC-1 TaxID=2495593 RepID=UPI000F85CB4A|nr:IclR family transcriptional regulator C-terminal domain-containing protein [Variovorax sp. MHTC-1]RST47910.1 hypothetical protein EJI01_27390 [Variovorax sp. MHTC-1]
MLIGFVEDSKSTRSKARHEEGRVKAGNAENHLDQFVDFLKYEIVEWLRSAWICRRREPIEHLAIATLAQVIHAPSLRSIGHGYQFGVAQLHHGHVQTSLGERDPELAAVAAPVFDARGKLLGALSLSGTSTRYSSPEYLQSMQARIASAAREIESLFISPQ